MDLDTTLGVSGGLRGMSAIALKNLMLSFHPNTKKVMIDHFMLSSEPQAWYDAR